jgi:hypothetical protein
MNRRRTALVCLVLVSLLTMLGGGTASGADPTSTGPNLVPDRSGAQASDATVLVSGPNVNISARAGAQSEAHVAVDPTDRRHILAASNDLAVNPPYTAVWESFDGGRTWASAGFSVPGIFCYDPWLDFNANGDAFFAYECGDQRIAFKRAGTTNWVHTTLVGPGPFPDRDMVVVDTHPSSPFFGSVYVGYDHATFNNAAHLSYSRDGFGGWLESPTINDAGGTIGVNAAVDADGGVNTVWLDWVGRRIESDHSTNGGANWGADDVVTNLRLQTGGFFICIPPQPDRCVVPMPFSTAAPEGSPFEGRIFVVYPDRNVAGTDWDVFLRFSDDNGTTWSPEVRVNDDAGGAYQFFPAVAVTRSGLVAVSFYDTRQDPNNEMTHRVIAFSRDGGATFGANERVTTAPSDASGPGDPNDYGDYAGLDPAGPNSFYGAWADLRVGAAAEDVFGAASKLG